MESHLCFETLIPYVVAVGCTFSCLSKARFFCSGDRGVEPPPSEEGASAKFLALYTPITCVDEDTFRFLGRHANKQSGREAARSLNKKNGVEKHLDTKPRTWRPGRWWWRKWSRVYGNGNGGAVEEESRHIITTKKSAHLRSVQKIGRTIRVFC